MSTLHVVPERAGLTDRVAAEVRAQMARIRMSQVQLAAVLDLPQTSVSARLRGKTPFKIDELEKVADALGVHPAVLLGGSANGSDSPPPSTARYQHGSVTGCNKLTRFRDVAPTGADESLPDAA